MTDRTGPGHRLAGGCAESGRAAQQRVRSWPASRARRWSGESWSQRVEWRKGVLGVAQQAACKACALGLVLQQGMAPRNPRLTSSSLLWHPEKSFTFHMKGCKARVDARQGEVTPERGEAGRDGASMLAGMSGERRHVQTCAGDACGAAQQAGGRQAGTRVRAHHALWHPQPPLLDASLPGISQDRHLLGRHRSADLLSASRHVLAQLSWL